MQEAELRALIEDVRTEKLPRRSFIERLVGLGLSAPMASDRKSTRLNSSH